ncbi:MAG: hypothetical protein ACI8XQ_001971, partial [Bermanella sp.]
MSPEKYDTKAATGGIETTALSPEVSKVLRSTYLLLAATVTFSALMAGVS